MRRSDSYLTLVFATALLVPAPASASATTDKERLHVEFGSAMPAMVQTVAYGGRDIDESSAQAYAHKVMFGEEVRTLVGYAVKPAPAGCDKPGLPCPDRRAALPDDRADDLPPRFQIEISDEPEDGTVRQAMRAAEISSDGPGPWVTPPAGQSPYPAYGAGTAYVLATDSGKLRTGALAQADCLDALRLCSVRMTYSRDLRVNFLSPATGEPLAKQVQAVDAFMRSVIRPGPLPGPGVGRPPTLAGRSPAQEVYFPGLPLNRIKAAGGFPR